MLWLLFGVGCFLAGWLFGWLMGICHTTTIYRALLREGADPHAWGLAAPLLLLLLPLTVWAQAPCSHYAAPQGGGSACSESQPCTIASWWPLAGPGKTLCLRSGTYRGGDQMITPPPQRAGQQGKPITIRAERDGTVLLDAQHEGFAVYLSGSSGHHWFVIEGLNAANGLEHLYRVSSNDVVLRRVIGWNGTEGQSDSNIFRLTGQRTLLEDCAGWGYNSRKIIDGAQAGNVQGATVRRCWAEWNDWPGGGSWPINTYQMGYGTTNQLYENVLGTTRRLGDLSPGDHEGVMRGFRGGGVPPFDMQGTKLLGSLFYTTPGVTNMGDSLFTSDEVANLYIEDFAAVVDGDRGESVTPWYMGNCIVAGECFGNVCKNCLAVHDGRAASAVSNAGWSFPGLRQGHGLAAATGGTSAFQLLPMLCKRVVKGQRTDTPLWPWPMNQRIKDARQASGYPSVDVTQTVQALLGSFPESCTTGGPLPPDDTTPPTVQLTAPSHAALVSGTALAVHAEAADDSGSVLGITFTLNDEAIPPEQAGPVAHVVIDTTLHPNDVYRLGATARDAAGNVGRSNQATVIVFNGQVPQPPPTGAHPAMRCVGALGEAGKMVLECTPMAQKR